MSIIAAIMLASSRVVGAFSHRLIVGWLASPAPDSGTPKGIDARTLRTVMQVLQQYEGPFSLKDIEPLAGISRISLKKYFDYLTATGRLGSVKDYGGPGRPVTLYNWIA